MQQGPQEIVNFWKSNCWKCGNTVHGYKHWWFGPTYKADSYSDPYLYYTTLAALLMYTSINFSQEQHVIGTLQI